ncbi:MAG: hypothetical protein K2K20_08005 [Lachnospiraceae bacterium]|nr:hypothetical protein [Lachnospiraceae bacterium]
MDKKFSILEFCSQVFTIYGITIVLLYIFCILFGESAQELSTIFSMGSQGLGIATSFQFLLAVLAITIIRFIFMTDILIIKMPTAARIAAMFVGTFAIILVFIIVFDWFPTDLPMAWIMFLICFVVCSTAGTMISLVVEKQENRKLEEALKRYKEEE